MYEDLMAPAKVINATAVLAIPCMALALMPVPANGASAAKVPRPVTSSVPAPELVGGTWLNLPNTAKPTLASRRGKVTVVHFWTFGCINCKHNLPFYQEWQKKFTPLGVEIIGIHTPETTEEKDPENVKKKVSEYGITYPVLIDGAAQNWGNWKQRYWPTVYLVDKKGRVRFTWEGELEYQNAGGNEKVTSLIESLLKE